MKVDHTVKRRDEETIRWVVNADLTGTVSHRLLIRKWGNTEIFKTPTSRIADAAAGIVEQDYEGDLDIGQYQVEVEVTRADGKPVTYPNGHNGERKFARLDVIEDIA